MLDAAALCIAKNGFAATSVEDIVAQAGYTRGALYSNFNSKLDLFVALLRADHQHFRKTILALLDAAPSCDDLQTQLAWLVERCYRSDDSYIIWAEARLHAMRDAQFRQCMNALCVEKRDLIATFIERRHPGIGLPLPHSYTGHALATISLMDGIRYFNMTIPDALPGARAGKILNDMVIRMLMGVWACDMPGRE